MKKKRAASSVHCYFSYELICEKTCLENENG